MEPTTTWFIAKRGGRIAPDPGGRLAQTLSIGGHCFEPAHQDVEQALARTFVGKLDAVLRQDRAVDAARKAGKHRAFRRKRVAEVGERNTGGLADVANRDLLEALLGGKLHQRIDDLAARIGGFGFRGFGFALGSACHSALLRLLGRQSICLRARRQAQTIFGAQAGALPDTVNRGDPYPAISAARSRAAAAARAMRSPRPPSP